MYTQLCALAFSVPVNAFPASTTGDKTDPSSKSDCFFVHGVGEKDAGPPTSTFPKYWGSVQKSMTQCANFSFVHYDSVTKAWHHPDTLNYVCDFLLDGDNDGTIRNKLIFTHSMGGNVLGHALKTGVCKLDSSAKWFAANPPQGGSIVADWIVDICDSPTDGSSMLNASFKQLALAMDVCESDGPFDSIYSPNEGFKSLQTTNPLYDGLSDYMFEHASGVMCGTSQTGLWTGFGATTQSMALPLLNELAPFDVSDGVVDISSCMGKFEKYFSSEYTSNFYKSDTNHLDGTCQNGDGLFDEDSRSPCKWYRSCGL